MEMLWRSQRFSSGTVFDIMQSGANDDHDFSTKDRQNAVDSISGDLGVASCPLGAHCIVSLPDGKIFSILCSEIILIFE